MSDVIRSAGPGPLSAVADPTVAKEIRKLWDVVSVGQGNIGDAGRRWATIDDLTAAKREVLSKIPGVDNTIQSPHLGGTKVVGGGGVDLLPLDNEWTGRNTFTKLSSLNTPVLRVASYGSGTILPLTGPSIMLENGYQALVDIRKTTNNALDAGSLGGNAALYIQHRVSIGAGNGPTLNVGLRVQMESWQSSNHPTNDVVAGYFGLYNHGFNSGGFGTHIDLYHAGTGNTVSYGTSVEVYREFLDGKVIAHHARVGNQGNYRLDADYAFLASPAYPGSDPGFGFIFSGGSNFTGPLSCSYGLDLAYARCGTAAIRVRGGDIIGLNGAANNVGFYFDPIGKIQFFSDVGKTVSIGNDGSLRVREGKYVRLDDNGAGDTGIVYTGGNVAIVIGGQGQFSFGGGGTLAMLNATTSGAAGKQIGYVAVNVRGSIVWIPYHA